MLDTTNFWTGLYSWNGLRKAGSRLALASILSLAVAACGGGGGGGGGSQDSQSSSALFLANSDSKLDVLSGESASKTINAVVTDQTDPSSSGVTPAGAESGAGFSFELVDGPSWASVTDSGKVQCTPPKDQTAGTKSIEVKVTDPETGSQETWEGQCEVMAAEVVAEGTVGPTGGTITGQGGQVTLTVPQGALESQVTAKVLRGIKESGGYYYKTRFPDGSLSVDSKEEMPTLSLPESGNRLPGSSSSDTSQTSGARTATGAGKVQGVRDTGEDWSVVYTHLATFVDPNGDPLNENRIPPFSYGSIPSVSGQFDVSATERIASQMFTRCGSLDQWSENCSGREPVVFIHGYTPSAPVIGGLGGGEGTWGELPDLIHETGNYAVFEFDWRTNARFQDAAADLAEAIGLVHRKFGQMADTPDQVHLVAHSFGGLLARTYLEDLAQGHSYNEDVASLATFGTPHSGIFPEAGERHGVQFPPGQDPQMTGAASLINQCSQLSCQGAGVATPSAWMIGDLSYKAFYGITYANPADKPGKLVADLASGLSDFPVPAKVFIGLTGDSYDCINGVDGELDHGDGLISYRGQRFNPADTCTDSSCESLNRLPGGTRTNTYNGYDVSEELLGWAQSNAATATSQMGPGFSDFPDDLTLPGFDAGGFSHGAKFSIFGCRAANGEASASGEEPGVSDGSPDEDQSYKALKKWLGDQDSGSAFESITLSLTVKDEQGNLVDASVVFGGNACPAEVPSTGSDGYLEKNMDFRPSSTYEARVFKDGYQAQTVTLTTSDTPDQSATSFGTVELVPTDPDKVDADLTVVDSSTGSALEDVQLQVHRSGNPGYEFSLSTDSSGQATLSDIYAGEYVVSLEKDGYTDRSVTVSLDSSSGSTATKELSLSQPLADGVAEIVLEWGENPDDLDSHLVKYDSSGNRVYQIAYWNKSPSGTSDNLDVDDVSSYGPETITIEQVDSDARYVYAVHHYGGSGSLTETSNAEVTLTHGDSTRTFNVPGTGEGIYWKVFEIDDGEVFPCNSDCLFSEGDSYDSPALGVKALQSGSTPDWLRTVSENQPAKE